MRRLSAMRAVITVIGKDMVGILARVSSICAENNVNVVEVTQSILQDLFAMIMMVDISRVFDPVPGSGGCTHRDWGRDGLDHPCHARGYFQFHASDLTSIGHFTFY